jgi:hypothetical protein
VDKLSAPRTAAVWLIAFLITSFSYVLNARGHGWVSFIAASALTRLAIDKMVSGSNSEKWTLSVGLTVFAALAYGLIVSTL